MADRPKPNPSALSADTLIEMCEAYISAVERGEYELKLCRETPDHLFEEVMMQLYGGDVFENYINPLVT